MKHPALIFWFGTLLAGAILLGGCISASQSQFDEEKEPHYLAGKNRVNSMDFDSAVESFQKALEVNPHSASAHFELGWLNDQKKNDPAAAIYHYRQYLRLRPKADNAEMVHARILACEQQLAQSVSLGPITQSMQKELDQLTEEKRRLKLENEQLKSQLALLQTLTNNSPRVQIYHPGDRIPQDRSTNGALRGASNDSPSRAVGSNRTHTVKSGETLSAIARTYGIKLDVLNAANPGLEPKKMKVGQTLVIPPGR